MKLLPLEKLKKIYRFLICLFHLLMSFPAFVIRGGADKSVARLGWKQATAI
jgi:hypothetical protein